MSDDKHFFLREPWVYDTKGPRPIRDDAADGFETRCLHAGFNPMQTQNDFRSFVPPLVQSITFPYETFDKIPCPVYGRTRTPTNTVLEERIASLEGGEACLTAAETLLARGEREKAMEMFDLVRQSDLPKYQHVAALQGTIGINFPAIIVRQHFLIRVAADNFLPGVFFIKK